MKMELELINDHQQFLSSSWTQENHFITKNLSKFGGGIKTWEPKKLKQALIEYKGKEFRKSTWS